MTKKRRPTYYQVFSLQDGTVLLAVPVRKPSARVLKDYRIKIDDDGVAEEYFMDTKWFRDAAQEDRQRRHDLVSNRLNMRRTIRELLIPRIAALEDHIAALQAQLDRIERHVGASENPRSS